MVLMIDWLKRVFWLDMDEKGGWSSSGSRNGSGGLGRNSPLICRNRAFFCFKNSHMLGVGSRVPRAPLGSARVNNVLNVWSFGFSYKFKWSIQSWRRWGISRACPPVQSMLVVMRHDFLNIVTEIQYTSYFKVTSEVKEAFNDNGYILFRYYS